ncbi:hypothetical protein P168DRAFT_303258 [Aspergillus campestris IBT 28561]|uniref:Ribonucleases P/MRP subunit Pop8-like domain-containing protein n=1 Tax=Aspergillus campestris (strain IBT 28561) TaxID=1392248 RepID=A0A2I1D6G5_ASPC2|nr:uncharacterized protein P168DRAFT_303258 [Aspergillus campestris IBT 28561]PKY05460.1 hypothetical protein P168DRAFT_303258 [Aspergillus campestris IBT 28561]
MSKRKPSEAPEAAATAPKTTHLTSRNSPWTYLKLQLTHQPNTSNTTKTQPLDPLTARTHLTSALSQFLGLTGTAIPLDILKITTPGLDTASDSGSTNQEKIVWVRVPRADATAVVDALSSWIGGGSGGGGGEDGDDAVGAVAWREMGNEI